jgi:hypothetical protein
MAEKFVVTLTAEERRRLTQLTTTGKGSAATLTHARILLQADAASTAGGYTDTDIATSVSVSLATIARVRKTFVEQGLEAALQRRPPTGPAIPQTGRCARSAPHCHCLWRASRRSRPLDSATIS